jgi:hypothetical protein
LDIFEYRVEIVHAFTSQKPDVSDETGYATSGEGASRESDEDDLISRNEVSSNKRIGFTDVLLKIVSYRKPLDGVAYF